MKMIIILFMFLFVFFVGYIASGGVDKFIKKNCSPFPEEDLCHLERKRKEKNLQDIKKNSSPEDPSSRKQHIS